MSAESLEEVHLEDMSATEKREQQALMRGTISLALRRSQNYKSIDAAPQEEVPPTGCGATLCTGVLVVVSVILLIFTFPFSLIAIIKVNI